MHLIDNQSQQEKAVPIIYRLYRWFFAASIVLGTAATLVTAATNPGYYSSQIGIALGRARAVPIWAAVLIALSRPLVFLYPFFSSLPGIYIQLPSWVLLFIGSIPAALAMLKTNGRGLAPTVSSQEEVGV